MSFDFRDNIRTPRFLLIVAIISTLSVYHIANKLNCKIIEKRLKQTYNVVSDNADGALRAVLWRDRRGPVRQRRPAQRHAAEHRGRKPARRTGQYCQESGIYCFFLCFVSYPARRTKNLCLII